MKTYLTSDLHFGHKNILKFCEKNRAHYGDVDTMNESMIAEWNAIVEAEDLVYILGDVAFLPSADAVKILKRLQGRKILIEGNHDRKLLNDPVFRSCFDEIHKYHWFNYGKTMIVMFHYPIAEWDRMHHGSVHFYGHLHGNPSGLERYRARDAGFDATGKIVWLLEDAIADAMKGEIKSHHG